MRSLWPRGGLWRHPDFLETLVAGVDQPLGTEISQLAIPLAAILVLDASAFEVAVVGGRRSGRSCSRCPGRLVDALRRKLILVVGDFGRARARDDPARLRLRRASIWQLYVVGFVVGTFTVFFDVAYQSYLPSLVSRDQLVDGNSKLEVSRSAASLADRASQACW